MSVPSDELVSYISSALAAGKTVEALRAELVAAGWAVADVEAALSSPAPANQPVESPAGSEPLVPWKLVIAAGCIVIIVAVAVAALFFFGKRTSPSVAVNNNVPTTNMPAVNAPVKPAKTDSSGGKAKDDVTVDDQDLVVYPSNVIDAANAYLNEENLRGVKNNSAAYPDVDILKQISGADPWNQKFADEVINNNGPFITSFSNAVGRPGFQVPEYSDPRSFDPARPAVNYDPLGRLAEVLALESLSLAKKGDASNAAAEALAIGIYGQKMVDSQIDVGGYLIGLNVKKLGLNTLKKILSGAKISAELAGQLEGTLASFDDASASLATAYKIDYWIYRNKLDEATKNPKKYYPDIAPEKFNDLYFFEPNKTINLLGENVRAAVAMTSEACREFSDQKISDVDLVALQKMDSENGFGKLYASALKTGWAKSLNARCADVALVASLRAQLAALVAEK